MCGSNDSTGQVVFLARMISLDGVNSTDLLPQLQQWTQTGPTITVQGVSLTISADCSVHLRDSNRPTCIRLTSPTPPTYAPTTVDQVEPSANSWPVIPLTAGLGGGMLFLIIIIIVLLVIVLVLKKRQSKQSYQVNRYDTCHTFHLCIRIA